MIDGEDGTTTTTEHETEASDTKGPVPYERFAALVAEKRALKGKAAEVDTMRAQIAELGKRAADAEAALAAGRSEWEERTALFRAGIDDDDGIDVARTLYARQPAEGRKPMAEWIAALKAEGATVPKPLAPYLAQQAGAPTKATPKPAPAQGQAPSAGGALTPEAISQAYAEAARNPHDAAAKARLAEIRALVSARA